jgi:hypothetical protein
MVVGRVQRAEDESSTSVRPWAGAMQKPRIPIVWTPHCDPYDRARAAFSASYMSDAKWRKAFGAIAGAGLHLDQAEWKFIESERLFDWGVPRLSDLLPTRLADGRFQPVEYKWIEWIRFPRAWRPIAKVADTITQDIEGLKQVLEAAGKFHYVEDEQGLTLFGYGR